MFKMICHHTVGMQSTECCMPNLSSVKPSAEVATKKSYELEAYSLMVIDCNAHAKGLM